MSASIAHFIYLDMA